VAGSCSDASEKIVLEYEPLIRQAFADFSGTICCGGAASGIKPASIRVLGVKGGEISAFEYRLALLLGAKVGILPESGGASRQIAGDQDWSGPGGAAEPGEKALLLQQF
jgi:hypothetical protein